VAWQEQYVHAEPFPDPMRKRVRAAAALGPGDVHDSSFVECNRSPIGALDCNFTFSRIPCYSLVNIMSKAQSLQKKLRGTDL
jgi:hypothetical protein